MLGASVDGELVLLGALDSVGLLVLLSSIDTGIPMIGANENIEPDGLPSAGAGVGVGCIEALDATSGILRVGATVGEGEEVGVGTLGALDNAGGAGRHSVLAQHVKPSGQSVSNAVMQGAWQLAFTSSQSFPQK